jgi:hypothetical protein
MADNIHDDRKDPIRQAFINAGLDPKTGRRLEYASGGAFTSDSAFNAVLRFFFAFYLMVGGNPFFIVLAQSSPIIEHKSSSKTTLAHVALEALVARGLVRPGTGEPTDIKHVHGLFSQPLIYFVKVDQEALVQKGKTFFGTKKYSLVDPTTGKTHGGNDASIIGFGHSEYDQMLKALSGTPISAPLPSSAGFARGGGGGAVAGGGGGAVAASHHHGGKTHSAPTCGHARCTHLHNTGAGHGAIVLPVFAYVCTDRSKKSVVISGFEKGSWNLFCEKMEGKDNGCFIATVERALREEAKIILSRRLENDDIKLGNPIGRTPVFYVQLDRSMVTHNLSRGVLNAQVSADNGNPSLPSCYKENQAIGFFERIGYNLVPLPGNPNPSSYPNIFSRVVQSWLSS